MELTDCIEEPPVPVSSTVLWVGVPAEQTTYVASNPEQLRDIAFLKAATLVPGHLESHSSSLSHSFMPLMIKPFQDAHSASPVTSRETPVPTTMATLFSRIRAANSALSSVWRTFATGHLSVCCQGTTACVEIQLFSRLLSFFSY
jgi:hypothetical protein